MAVPDPGVRGRSDATGGLDGRASRTRTRGSYAASRPRALGRRCPASRDHALRIHPPCARARRRLPRRDVAQTIAISYSRPQACSESPYGSLGTRRRGSTKSDSRTAAPYAPRAADDRRARDERLEGTGRLRLLRADSWRTASAASPAVLTPDDTVCHGRHVRSPGTRSPYASRTRQGGEAHGRGAYADGWCWCRSAAR
jgi:hypothetical protein